VSLVAHAHTPCSASPLYPCAHTHAHTHNGSGAGQGARSLLQALTRLCAPANEALFLLVTKAMLLCSCWLLLQCALFLMPAPCCMHAVCRPMYLVLLVLVGCSLKHAHSVLATLSCLLRGPGVSDRLHQGTLCVLTLRRLVCLPIVSPCLGAQTYTRACVGRGKQHDVYAGGAGRLEERHRNWTAHLHRHLDVCGDAPLAAI